MDETYRMLGREREADFAREAERARTASLLPARKRGRRWFRAPLFSRGRDAAAGVTGEAAGEGA